MIQPPRTHLAELNVGAISAPTSAPWRAMCRCVVLGGCGLVLAGCVSETSPAPIQPEDGVPADDAVEEFVLTVAAAESIADNCRDYGLRRNYRNSDELTASFLRGMLKQGYTAKELERAVDGISDEAVANEAVARFKRLGVREGDTGAICRIGLEEVAEETPLGRLLRVSQ